MPSLHNVLFDLFLLSTCFFYLFEHFIYVCFQEKKELENDLRNFFLNISYFKFNIDFVKHSFGDHDFFIRDISTTTNLNFVRQRKKKIN